MDENLTNPIGPLAVDIYGGCPDSRSLPLDFALLNVVNNLLAEDREQNRLHC